MYNLLTESWIPFRRQSGAIEWGPPYRLVSQLETDPVIDVAGPRPDFDGVLLEFLIGLLTVAIEPVDEAEWQTLWNKPPNESELRTLLDGLPAAFNLDGDGPRFLQDFSAADLEGIAVSPIEQLLLDSPGDQTARLNKDLFNKRGQVAGLCRPMAAVALLAMQTYAPAGGKGHRTSLRGGGPLTTLVDPRPNDEAPLWQMLWANVETAEEWNNRERNPARLPKKPEAVFPWLAATRTSDPGKGASTTPSDAHPLQCYFGVPRRIRLEFGPSGKCSLTGQSDDAIVTGFRMRSYGVQYDAWKHPLSPHYTKKDAGLLAKHGQPGGVGWKDWLGLVVGSKAEGTEPARCVEVFNQKRLHRVSEESNASHTRLLAFGYDFDQMKARGWVNAALPVISAAKADDLEVVESFAKSLTSAAEIAAADLFFAVRNALYSDPKDVKGDLAFIRASLWEALESPFYDAMREIAMSSNLERVSEERRGFRSQIEVETLKAFDLCCPTSGAEPANMKRLIQARFDLLMTLRGFSTSGKKLFQALQIPLPESKKAGKLRRVQTPAKRV